MTEIFSTISVTPGVQPIEDSTTASTPHYVAADKVRFRDGYPEKIGGWLALSIDNNDVVQGCTRAIFSYNISNNIRYLFGTHSHLYGFIGSRLTNVTPLVTATTAIANSLDSNFGTLGSDPIATTIGSTTVTVTDIATRVRVGDTVTLSLSTAVNGIPAGEINTDHFVRSQTTDSYTFIVATAATSTGSGGGGSVVQATAIVTVNQTAHGFSDDDRAKIASAATFAGIPASEINIEHIIRNVSANEYDFTVVTRATSSVSGGGGASTTVQGQIAAGLCDSTGGQGYGAGLYGVGLYGTALVSGTGVTDARVWVFDRFGNNVVMTPGQQTNIYTWDSDTAEAPIILANAPTAVNYVFVSNEIVVSLGAGGVTNRVQWSDQGNSTVWSAAATNQAGQDDIEGASEFLSQVNVKGINLLFTESQVYTMRYIGRPFVWEFRLLDEKSGIIAKNARIQHNGVAYWMGPDNFYYYRSGNVEIIPSTTTNETTLKRFVFDNINLLQKDKIFTWFNRAFNEIWWHYPDITSDEPNRIVRFNVKDFTWTPDTMDRSAGEYPTSLREFPYMAERITGASDTTTIYEQERGTDANGVALSWSLSTPFFDSGTDTVNELALIPDSNQVGDLTTTVNVKQYPQSPSLYDSRTLTISPTTEVVSYRVNSRFIQYVLAGNVLGQSWRAGKWIQSLSKGGRR